VVGVDDLLLLARRGGSLTISDGELKSGGRIELYGRKLHAEFGRLATRVNISDMSLCCTLVSWCGDENVHLQAFKEHERVLVECRTWSTVAGRHY